MLTSRAALLPEEVPSNNHAAEPAKPVNDHTDEMPDAQGACWRRLRATQRRNAPEADEIAGRGCQPFPNTTFRSRLSESGSFEDPTICRLDPTEFFRTRR